jgi:hypothetical protein
MQLVKSGEPTSTELEYGSGLNSLAANLGSNLGSLVRAGLEKSGISMRARRALRASALGVENFFMSIEDGIYGTIEDRTDAYNELYGVCRVLFENNGPRVKSSGEEAVERVALPSIPGQATAWVQRRSDSNEFQLFARETQLSDDGMTFRVRDVETAVLLGSAKRRVISQKVLLTPRHAEDFDHLEVRTHTTKFRPVSAKGAVALTEHVISAMLPPELIHGQSV